MNKKPCAQRPSRKDLCGDMVEDHQAWVVYFDGACEPVNPGGTASYGWIIYQPDGTHFASGSKIIGSGPGMTNNLAEFAALEAPLVFIKQAAFPSKIHLICRGDSQLVVHQVNGRWRCHKAHLQPYLDRIRVLLEEVAESWVIEWIPREQNAEADALSKGKSLVETPDWLEQAESHLSSINRTS